MFYKNNCETNSVISNAVIYDIFQSKISKINLFLYAKIG